MNNNFIKGFIFNQKNTFVFMRKTILQIKNHFFFNFLKQITFGSGL